MDLARQHRSIRYGQLCPGLAVPVPLDSETWQRFVSRVLAELAGGSRREPLLDDQPAGGVEDAVYAQVLTVQGTFETGGPTGLICPLFSLPSPPYPLPCQDQEI